MYLYSSNFFLGSCLTADLLALMEYIPASHQRMQGAWQPEGGTRHLRRNLRCADLIQTKSLLNTIGLGPSNCIPQSEADMHTDIQCLHILQWVYFAAVVATIRSSMGAQAVDPIQLDQPPLESVIEKIFCLIIPVRVPCKKSGWLMSQETRFLYKKTAKIKVLAQRC